MTPDAPPVDRATVLVRDGRIVSVERDGPVPPGTPVIAGEGGTVSAGFWNCHVHFTERKWRRSGRSPAAELNGYLRDMLTSRGFTTVVDTGSNPRVTGELRRRVDSGEVPGPRIFTSGVPLYPPRGIPYYVRPEIPFWIRPLVPQPSSESAARRAVERNVAHGAEVVKLFTGSYVQRGVVKPMPEPVARAAVEAAHAHHRLVFSHASNLEGCRVAARAGVDILAHPPDLTEGVDDGFLRELVVRGMSIIPTLQMFEVTVSADPGKYLEPIYSVVRRFRALGGNLLFGTDVGYMHDYSTEKEFRALEKSGVERREILRMLTLGPAERFGVDHETGSLSPGKRADLVLLDGDPLEDASAFSRVRVTVRAGNAVFTAH